MKRGLMLALVLAATNCAAPRGQEAVAMQTLIYTRAPTTNGEIGLSLDLYRPADHRGSLPTLVVLHGGGFIGGARDLQENTELARALAARGYAVASISYRLQRDRPTLGAWGQAYANYIRTSDQPSIRALVSSQGEEWADAVAAAAEDASSAVSWVRANAADYDLDANRIALVGMSAGAVTSAMLAYKLTALGAPASGVSAVVCIRGSILGNDASHFRNGPPLLIAHGDADTIVPLVEAQHTYTLARSANVPVEFYVVPGVGHELGGAQLLSTQFGGQPFEQHLDRFLRAAFDRRESMDGATCSGPEGACPP